MRTVPFQQVLHGTARLLGLNPTRDMTTDRAATLTEYLQKALDLAWQTDWFPEWMECEQRQFRQNYAPGEFLTAGDERYHIGSDAYYQALQGQAAASIAPATANVENSTHWALCRTSYNAPDQVSGEVLAVGYQRRDPDTGKTYQVFTAHTTTSVTVDTTKAGEVRPLARYISFEQVDQTPIGTVKGIHQQDPRVFPGRSGKLNHAINSRGVIITAGQTVPNRVWVEFRLRPPQFTSVPWAQPASGEGYDLGALVYSQGGVFKSLVGENEVPLDNTAQWDYVGFPTILVKHCQLAAAADCQTDQKQNSRKNDLMQDAAEELDRVREQEITSQQEPERCEVMTYGR